MDDFQLLIDLHKDAVRQGPGGEAETRLALDLAGVDKATPLKIADLGCGTGASTVLLARLLNARITAVDLFQDFLDLLEDRAEHEGVAEKISTHAGSMDDLPFADEELDVIWSEGAIYNLGFRKGARDWRRYLKTGGLLAVSEITWLTQERPTELQSHWESLYPEVDVASVKIRILEECGFSPVGYFPLPEHCWLDHYYRPMQARFDAFLTKHGNSEEARDLVAAEKKDIELYETYRAYFSYGFYLARKSE